MASHPLTQRGFHAGGYVQIANPAYLWAAEGLNIADALPVPWFDFAQNLIVPSSNGITAEGVRYISLHETMPSKHGHRHIQPPKNITANLIPAFVPDMYNRIWFLSGELPLEEDWGVFVDFGIILQPTTKHFIIWNAYLDRESVTCTAIEMTDDAQFTITDPIYGRTPPWTLLSNAYIEYDATAFEIGDFQFRVTVTWDFGPTVFPQLTEGLFVGIRSTLFPFAPLDGTMDEMLQWFSEVIPANSGKEQRIRVRQYPRGGFKFKAFIPTEEKISHLESLLYQWSKRSWGVPYWAEAHMYTEDIIVGQLVIPNMSVGQTETFPDNSRFAAGQVVLFWQGPNQYALNIIENIDLINDELELQLEMSAAFTGNTFIIPVNAAWMTKVTKVVITPDKQGTVNVAFSMVYPEILPTTYTPLLTLPNDPSSGAELLPVLLEPSIVRRRQTLQIAGDTKAVDYDAGMFGIYSDSEYVKAMHDFRFRKESKADCWELRELFHYLQGKINCIWIPTYRRDMTLDTGSPVEVPVLSVVTDINVVESYIGLQYGQNENRRALHFEYTDGTQIEHLITNIVMNPDDTVKITLSEQLGKDTTNANCTISWLDKVRLSTDKVKINWELMNRLESKQKFLRVDN